MRIKIPLSTLPIFFLLFFIPNYVFSDPAPSTKLKVRQPNWRPKVIETYERGSPRAILLLEPVKDSDAEAPVKLLEYSEDGVIRSETDLLPVGEGASATYLPHGPSIVYSPKGAAEVITFYDRGVLFESVRTFFPNGQLRTLAPIKGGKFDGTAEIYDENGNLIETLSYVEGELGGDVRQFYPGKSKKGQRHYLKGLLQGEATEWYEDGKTKSVAHYNRGLLNGVRGKIALTRYHPNGKIAETQDFRQGQPVGKHVRYDLEGVETYRADYFGGEIVGGPKKAAIDPIEKIHVKANDVPSLDEEMSAEPILEGDVTVCYPNGAPMHACRYREGKIDGPWQSWHEDGSPHEIFNFVDGLPTGQHLIYYPAGSAGSSQIFRKLNYHEGKLHGEQKSYYPDGTQQALMIYCDGVLNGKKVLWDEKGVMLEESHYREGSLEGRYYRRYPDGSESIYHYRNNRLDGPYQAYYPPNDFFGRVKSAEGTYKNGLLEGELSEYNEVATKVTSTHYHKGEKEGLATLFSNDGKTALTAEFHHDNQNGMAIEYHPNGTVKRQVLFVEDLKEGQERGFHPNGQPLSIANYKNGKLDGVSRQWNGEGILIFEAEYKDGKRHGKFNKYNVQGKPVVIQTFADDVLIEKQRMEDAQ